MDKLLLVNASPEKGANKWSTPGGAVRKGETLPQALEREIYEEVGLQIRTRDIPAVSEFFDPEDAVHQTDSFFTAD